MDAARRRARRSGVGASATADAVLVPALAVGATACGSAAAAGPTTGRCRGARRRAETAALLFDGERVAIVPAEPWDRPGATRVVTPAGWTRLR